MSNMGDSSLQIDVGEFLLNRLSNISVYRSQSLNELINQIVVDEINQIKSREKYLKKKFYRCNYNFSFTGTIKIDSGDPVLFSDCGRKYKFVFNELLFDVIKPVMLYGKDGVIKLFENELLSFRNGTLTDVETVPTGENDALFYFPCEGLKVKLRGKYSLYFKGDKTERLIAPSFSSF